LILDDGEARPGAKGDVEFDSIQLPEWLSELKSAVPEPDQPAPGQKAGDLAPATIPAWLEAMRPIDSFRSVVEIEPEEEQSIEAAGPLAGLRGVLLAEPVVAIPRSAPSAGGQVDVTERHYAQAELLQRILAEEAQEVPHAAPKKRRLSLTSGVVSAVLLLAAALPPILGTPTFPVPSTAQWPPELSPFIEKVNALPSGQPALVVFDYEPGYAGEMEAVAGPVIDHLMRQAVPLVSLSTRPTGPSLAERLLSRYSGLHSTPAGTAYVHLGYLPGGPTAVQAFVAAPRAAGLSGFLAPESAAAGGPWASPILASVNHLSDFGAIVLLSAGAESARAWVEQAAPARGETPLLLVVSAGVEPVMRPYYEATRPQVAGLLSGLPVALAYEQANGRQGDALSRWNSFGSSALAAEILLGIGAALAGARWVVGRRRPA
jgi:hypothetical protein